MRRLDWYRAGDRSYSFAYPGNGVTLSHCHEEGHERVSIEVTVYHGDQRLGVARTEQALDGLSLEDGLTLAESKLRVVSPIAWTAYATAVFVGADPAPAEVADTIPPSDGVSHEAA